MSKKKIARYAEGFDGSTVRVAYTFESKNTKTGDVIQQWITPKNWERESQKEKVDVKDSAAACKDCPLMDSCYVKKGTAVMGLKSGSKSKNFIPATEEEQLYRFEKKFVRFGAFGEPVLAGKMNTVALASVAKNWTGYTHQWKDLNYHWSNKYFMASVETPKLKSEANALGYRTFRVGADVSEILPDEVLCPASKEAGRKATCADCGLCKGASSKAKNVFIVKH